MESLVTLGLAVSSMDGGTITMTGSSDGNWFGVGFGTHHVMPGTYDCETGSTPVAEGDVSVRDRVRALVDINLVESQPEDTVQRRVTRDFCGKLRGAQTAVGAFDVDSTCPEALTW